METFHIVYLKDNSSFYSTGVNIQGEDMSDALFTFEQNYDYHKILVCHVINDATTLLNIDN